MDSAGGSVLGHYNVVGANHLQPLLSESQPLFQALVQGNLEALVACLEDSPDAHMRLHNVLHWSAGDELAQRGPKSSVSVVQTSLLAIAAYHATSTEAGLAVVQLLLQRGANPLLASPDGATALTMAQQAGDKQVLAILQSAVQVQEAHQHVLGSGSHSSPHSVDGHSSPQGSQSLGLARPSMTRSSSGNRVLDMPLCAPDLAAVTFSADASSSDHGSRDTNVWAQHHVGLHQEVEVDPFHTDSCLDGCMPYNTAELVQPEYSNDDFRMFSFKVMRCSKRFAHDWRACPFAHPTENARRRDPRDFRYCAIACPDYKQGFCVRGDLCPYAHGVFEAWLHPSRYRTQLCKDGANCHRPICFFAHSLSELRTPTHTWTPGSDDCPAASAGGAAAAAGMPGVSDLSGSQATSQGQSAGGGVIRSISSGLQSSGVPSARTTTTGTRSEISNSGNQALCSSSTTSCSGTPGAAAPALAPASAPACHSTVNKDAAGPWTADAASVVPPAAPGTAAAAKFGFTAPRMSNAFARRHGLNPKDNAMLNLQKIALQAQPGGILSDQLTRMIHAQGGVGVGAAAGSLLPTGMQPHDMYGARGAAGLGAGMHGPHAMAGHGGFARGSKVHPGQAGLMHGNPLMMPGFPYGSPNGLAAMQAMAAAAAHDPNALASLHHHLASLSLHPTAAAAYAGQAGAMGMGMGGYGGGMGFGHANAGAMASQ